MIKPGIFVVPWSLKDLAFDPDRAKGNFQSASCTRDWGFSWAISSSICASVTSNWLLMIAKVEADKFSTITELLHSVLWWCGANSSYCSSGLYWTRYALNSIHKGYLPQLKPWKNWCGKSCHFASIKSREERCGAINADSKSFRHKLKSSIWEEEWS